MPLPDGSLLAGEIKIFLPIKMQFKIMLWNELIARGITLSTLARQLKMTPSQAQRLVDLTQDRVSTDSLESVLSRIGVRVTASEDRW